MSIAKLDCHGLTDTGRKRGENEDQFLIADLVKAVRVQATSLSHDDHTEVTGQSQGKVFLVADGMGRQLAGRRASTLAVDETIDFMVNRMRWSAFGRLAAGNQEDASLSLDLKAALKHCQERIRSEAKWDPNKHGMGAALTIAILDWPSLRIVHAGSCRCFLEHGGYLSELTSGGNGGSVATKANEASGLPSALNIVGGPTAELQPEVYDAELSIGDTLLLCTDGLSKHVTEDSLAEVVQRDTSAGHVCAELVEMANAGGGSDNITVVVARFLDAANVPNQLAAEVAIEQPQTEQKANVEVGRQGEETPSRASAS